MVKRRAGSLFLPLTLDPELDVPIYRQLYEELRRAILSGQLAAGVQLPATRTLASLLGISRTTVVVSFEQLLAEGYVCGQVGSGTYVAAVLPEVQQTCVELAVEETQQQAPPVRRRLSQRGMLPAALTSANINPTRKAGAFTPGTPDLSQFPFKTWARLATHRWRNPPHDLLGYSDPAGYRPLREEIAAYVKAVRGVNCEVEQVLVVSGAQQGIALAAHILLDPHDKVWIEDPCYQSARRALQGSGAELTYIPVDNEGLDVGAAMQRCPDARLVYVTPSFQFPGGSTMSLARRLRLLKWASETGAWILEDDYDCEYRYVGRPLSSLQGLDSSGQVIYIGTYSKVLFPGLRLGYIVVPPDLVDAFTAARAAMDRHSAMMEQIVLTDFLYQGHFIRHMRHTRQLYGERQEILVAEAKRELAGLLELPAAEAGMHLIGRLPTGMNDEEVARRARLQGVIVPPISMYSVEQRPPDALLLGYTAVNAQEIYSGIQALASVLSGYQRF